MPDMPTAPDPTSTPPPSGPTLSYRRELRPRPGWHWLILLLLCHAVASYAIVLDWMIRQAALHKPQDMPLAVGAFMPVISPLLLARCAFGLIAFPSRTFAVALHVLIGYTAGFLIPLCLGLWLFLRRRDHARPTAPPA